MKKDEMQHSKWQRGKRGVTDRKEEKEKNRNRMAKKDRNQHTEGLMKSTFKDFCPKEQIFKRINEFLIGLKLNILPCFCLLFAFFFDRFILCVGDIFLDNNLKMKMTVFLSFSYKNVIYSSHSTT